MTFDLATTLAPVIRIARESGLDVTADLVAAPPANGRPADTTTVVHTLLANAARYAGNGPVTVTARMTQSTVQVVVADRGPGVDPDEREAIFQRGVRGRASAGREGSGLGLFIARWLMDEQEGALTYEPRSGGGACFVITLSGSAGNGTNVHHKGDDRARKRGMSTVGGAS